jgi:hypothetical protein
MKEFGSLLGSCGWRGGKLLTALYDHPRALKNLLVKLAASIAAPVRRCNLIGTSQKTNGGLVSPRWRKERARFKVQVGAKSMLGGWRCAA